jgi:hypothetical protein
MRFLPCEETMGRSFQKCLYVIAWTTQYSNSIYAQRYNSLVSTHFHS